MGQQETRVPVGPSQVLEAFTDALTKSEGLRDTFTRMGETDLAAIAERNGMSIVSARDMFLSIVEPVAAKPCGFCEASPGDNDHCVWDGTPHYWHRCSGIVAPDSNCPEAVSGE